MARATNKVGIRALLGQTVVGFPVADSPDPYGGIRLIESLIIEMKKYPLIALSLAPHAPYTVSSEKLLEVKRISDTHNLTLHIHAAEFKGEEYQIKDNKKRLSVIQYLEDIKFLGSNVCLAHCNHVNDNDLDIIRNRRCRIAHNPMANAKGATGIAPITEAIERDIPVGLGTDGPMGSNVLSLFRVMLHCVNLQRLRKMDRTIMTPDIVVRLATLGGAKALGIDHQVGSLEKGKQADIVIVETQSINMIPNYNPYATLVFQANPHNVQTTIVDGKVVVENRKIKTLDIQEAKENMGKWLPEIGAFGKELSQRVKNKNSL